MFKNKIVIGTANFSKAYGFKRKKISKIELKKIFTYLKKKKIYYFDTASSYGGSEKILGQYRLSNNKVITKLPKIEKKNINHFIEKRVKKSLRDTKENKLHAILLHSASDLLSKNSDEIFKILKRFKSSKIAKKIGVSSYDIKEVDKIIQKYKIDIVQIPLSILDQRICKNGWIRKIKNKNIEIHVRSIFLQGLLLEDLSEIDNKFKKWKKYFKKWDDFCIENSISKEFGALKFVQSKNIDKLVIGINSLSELKKNIQILNDKKKIKFTKSLNCEDNKLLNPFNWI